MALGKHSTTGMFVCQTNCGGKRHATRGSTSILLASTRIGPAGPASLTHATARDVQYFAAQNRPKLLLAERLNDCNFCRDRNYG